MIKYFMILCFCLTLSVTAQSNHPYASNQPLLNPEIFRIPGINNMWHISFTPDGNTIFFLDDYNHMESIFYSDFIDGKWSEPKLVSFSGKYRIETPSLSPDGTKLFFTLPIQIDTINHYDSAAFHMAVKTDTGWSEPKKMGPEVNVSVFQNCPRIVSNGSFYFTGFRNNGIYLYCSKLENGKYTTAQKVGKMMSMYKTADFCIAQDESYIIFQHFDNLYISFNNKGQWSAAISLGNRINTRLYETRPYISPDENYLFYKRLDPEKNWSGDYYQVDIKPLVESLRKTFIDYSRDTNSINLAAGKKVSSSSNKNQFLTSQKTVDDSLETCWASEQNDNPQWLMIDLNKTEKIRTITILWEAFAAEYKIEVSLDSINWKEVFSTNTGTGGLARLEFAPAEARYVKLTGLKPGTQYGYSISELGIFSQNGE